jgi:hypothetical protein
MTTEKHDHTIFKNIARGFYFKNEWTDRLGKIPSYRFSIKEYMESHNQKIPEWAKTYAERGIYDKKTFLAENDAGACTEIESFETANGEATAIRHYHIGGTRRTVEMIYPVSDNVFVFRQEKSFFKGKWSVTSEIRMSKEDVENHMSKWS